MTERRDKRQNEPGNLENSATQNQATSGKQKKASSAPPGITPGYDFIWGSDQDDLMNDPDRIVDPDDVDDLYRLDRPDDTYDR
jgi:hypothetical protein